MSDPIHPDELRREARRFRALASEARLAIVYSLAQGDKSVGELVSVLESLECACSMERTNISKHLAVLRESGIVSFRDDGQKRIYKLEYPCIANTFECMESRSPGWKFIPRPGGKDCGCA